MANTEIDYDKLERNLAILMTNHVSLASKLYDIFVSTTPMDVEIKVWTDKNKYESFWIPNRAKGNIPAQFGNGNPNTLEIAANYGCLYLDMDTSSVYIKMTLDGTSGWKKLMTEDEMKAHNIDANAHDGFLARINGDDAEIFRVADAQDDMDAVNMRSVRTILGGTENLLTENRDDFTGAVNEVVGSLAYDMGSPVRGQKTSTGTSNLMFLRADATGAETLVVKAPFVVCTPDGRQVSYTEDLTKAVGSLIAGERYSIYLDYSLQIKRIDNKYAGIEEEVTGEEIYIQKGKFIKDTQRPPFMEVGDVWMNLSSVPYVMENIVDGFEHEEVTWVYLGELVYSNPIVAGLGG